MWAPVNHDIHVLPQGVQESDETVRREAAELTANQIRYVRLIHTELCGRCRLRETPPFYGRSDLYRNFGLGERFGAVRNPKVCEDVT
jgi:hypothetical protein